MVNLIAGLIAIATFLVWGLFLLERIWEYPDDIDSGFIFSIIPVAIAVWYSLWLLRA